MECTSDIKSVELCQLISDIDAISHIDFFGINIANIVYNFFKIIKVTPSFLSAYEDYDIMPIYIPPNVEKSQFDTSIFIKAMKLQQEIFLLKLTMEYIQKNMTDDIDDFIDSDNSSVSDSSDSDSSVLSDEDPGIPIDDIIHATDFKKYMFKIFLIYSEIRNAKLLPSDFILKHKNTHLMNHDKGVSVAPSLKHCVTIRTTAISIIKDFVECVKSHKLFSTPVEEKPEQSFSSAIKQNPDTSFFSLHNIPNIIMYPFIVNQEIYYDSLDTIFGKSVNTLSREFLHEFVMLAKKQVTYVQYIPFYKCMRTNSINRSQQNIILLKYDKFPNESIYINKSGDICNTPYGELADVKPGNLECSWSIEPIFRIKFDMKSTIALDIIIAKMDPISNLTGSIINWNQNRKLLLQPPYNLRRDEITWMIPKLNVANLKSNIHETIMELKSKIHRVNPEIITTSFDSLDLSTHMRNNILKHFITYDTVRIYNNDILFNQSNSKFIIGIDDPIPQIIEINFDMKYCLSCLKIQTNRDVIKKKYYNNYMEKKCRPIKQPCICCDCFDFLLKIMPDSSNSIKITADLIDLCLIREKFSILMMGFKYDETSILHGANLDIIHYIWHMYFGSVKILTQFK